MDNIYKMDNSKLGEIISKFEVPTEKYIIEKYGEFGESELYWIIESQESHLKYLLVSTYWHPGVEEEINFYKENGIIIKKPILRKPETLEVIEDKMDPIRKYIYYDIYALFLI